MPPALTNAHTLEKSSQMENFFTRYDSMPPALTNTHTRKILTNGKFPHPCMQYDSMPPALTNAIEKSSKMEYFLTQHDSMPPALTDTHTL